MSDQDRRALARSAGEGDLPAARKLVKLLEREQNLALGPETLLRDLPNEKFHDIRVKLILTTLPHPGAIQTLGDLAGYTALRLIDVKEASRRSAGARRVGNALLLKAVNDILLSAGLKLLPSVHKRRNGQEVEMKFADDPPKFPWTAW